MSRKLILLQLVLAAICGSETELWFLVPGETSNQVVAGQEPRDGGAKERERQATREQFKQNFRELQLLGIGLLKAHESGDLKASRLAKDTRAIQKRARALRGLMVLGQRVAPVDEVDRQIDSAAKFDHSIRHLARLISEFAHNPLHQNSKVFNTEDAAQASADLISIIDLAKAIENQAVHYVRA
jgi:hypothetical protein